MGAPEALLSVRGLEKIYGNKTAALRGVSFDVAGATVHGLIGANGAGKSTLIKILSGAVGASGGTLIWQGEARTWRTPAGALAAGIATIHQHIPLATTLSVIENVFLGSDRRWRKSQDERIRFRELLDAIGYDIDPDALVSELPIGRRQMVSIMQALAADARLLVMDEPTASLSDSERAVVFQTIRRLAESGTAILFISHFLDEVLDLCDHVTVLRDGLVALDDTRAAVDERRLVEAIVGKTPARHASRERAGLTADAPLLEVEGLESPSGIRGIDLAVRPGEIVGLAGLLGSGRSEIMHAIFGADRRATGSVKVDGTVVERSIESAIAAGVLMVPEDRNGQALFLDESIRWNLSLPNSHGVSRFNLMPVLALEEERARRVMKAFSVVAPDSAVEVRALSGGNAQKIALGRALSGRCKVLLLDEPTAGVDIGAKADIRRVIDEIAASGVAVVVAISDFEELLITCTRIAVVSQGRIIGEYLPADTSEHELVAAAGGLVN